MAVARGDLWFCTPKGGDYEKPRPVLVVQADEFNAARDSVTVCLLTSELIEAPLFRVRVERPAEAGLPVTSDVMVDKVMTVTKARLRRKLGRLSTSQMRQVDAALAMWLGLAR